MKRVFAGVIQIWIIKKKATGPRAMLGQDTKLGLNAEPDCSFYSPRNVVFNQEFSNQHQWGYASYGPSPFPEKMMR